MSKVNFATHRCIRIAALLRNSRNSRPHQTPIKCHIHASKYQKQTFASHIKMQKNKYAHIHPKYKRRISAKSLMTSFIPADIRLILSFVYLFLSRYFVSCPDNLGHLIFIFLYSNTGLSAAASASF